jgi:hypothetical protein
MLDRIDKLENKKRARTRGPAATEKAIALSRNRTSARSGFASESIWTVSAFTRSSPQNGIGTPTELCSTLAQDGR